MLPWKPPAHNNNNNNNNNNNSNNQQSGNMSMPMSGLMGEGNGASGEGQHNAPLQQQQQSAPPQQPLQQQQQQQQQNLPPPPIPASSTAAGQSWTQGSAPLNLSHVLHFLQSEFRKYERERNEWEIERGEMRARIALLEGERRGNDNARADLLRRVKMLEFALKGERSKYLSLQQQSQASGIPAHKQSALKNEDRPASPSSSSGESSQSQQQQQQQQQKERHNLNTSSTSQPASSSEQQPSNAAAEEHKAQGLGVPMQQQSVSRPTSALSNANLHQQNTQTWNLNANTKDFAQLNTSALTGAASQNTWNPAIGRDRRGQAKSRDYLKQCLQEISYLTSPAALNPLSDQSASGIARPRKTVNPNMPASSAMELSTSMFPPPPPPPTSHAPNAPPTAADPSSSSAGAGAAPGPPEPQPNGFPSTLPPVSGSSQPPPTPTSPSRELPGEDASDEAKSRSKETSEPLTAIFRPGSGESWRAQLDAAGGKSGKEGSGGAALDGPEGLDADDAELDESPISALNSSASGMWKPRRIFRSHLDAVRAVAFGRSSDFTLLSGSDDMTVKVWRLNAHTLSPASTRTTSLPETEPQATLRGHSAAVTGLAVAGSQDLFFSGSLDQSVQVWRIPSRERETYDPYDASLQVTQLEGHTDAVWDVAALPLRVKEEQLLATASADGCVKIWSTDNPGSPLKLSWRFNGVDAAESDAQEAKSLPTPTALAVLPADLKRLAVAYSNATIRIFDVETGNSVLQLQSSEAGSGSQVNCLVAHPTLPMLVAGCEDGQIQLYDTNSGELSHAMAAHTDAVTSVDIDGGGLNLLSGGHDGSVRWWDLLGSRNCIQEVSAHRIKAGEGVLAVKYHASLPYCASAGADGLVKLYSM